MDARAIVAREPKGGPTWALETITVGAPADDEVLVQITAAGICHTDILFSSMPQGVLGVAYPKIVGHEGANVPRPAEDRLLINVRSWYNPSSRQERKQSRSRRQSSFVILLMLELRTLQSVAPDLLHTIQSGELRRPQMGGHGVQGRRRGSLGAVLWAVQFCRVHACGGKQCCECQRLAAE